MTFDPYKLIKYHLYLLQLENYELGRFWQLLINKGWYPQENQRKNLVWTKKLALIFFLAEFFIVLIAAYFLYQGFYMPFAFWWQKLLTFLVVVYVLDFFAPLFLSVAAIILWPIDFFVKQAVVGKAKRKIETLKNVKIIGIAGSYGKTTMKEVLKQVLGSRFEVKATPDSVNTPVGIARWVLNKIDSSAQILIVEMGEHYKGDVSELCRLAPPDVAMVTGINQAHLERMGSMENIAATIFEIAGGTKPNADVLINADDKHAITEHKKFTSGKKVVEYSGSEIKQKTFDPEKLCWNFEIEGLGNLQTSLLGEYALADIAAAVKIAKSLGMEPQDIKAGIAKIKPIEHRLQPIFSAQNILVIDDSYNGNPDGAAEAIKVLSRFANRRKIYITPGLVETGESAAEIHRAIGRQLAEVADVVILIKNSVTPYIELGIKNYKSRTPEIIWFNSAPEAHQELKNILKPGDVIVFQNDWGDNYV